MCVEIWRGERGETSSPAHPPVCKKKTIKTSPKRTPKRDSTPPTPPRDLQRPRAATGFHCSLSGLVQFPVR